MVVSWKIHLGDRRGRRALLASCAGVGHQEALLGVRGSHGKVWVSEVELWVDGDVV